MGELERATRSTESKPPRPSRSSREVVRSSPELGERVKWEEGWFSLRTMGSQSGSRGFYDVDGEVGDDGEVDDDGEVGDEVMLSPVREASFGGNRTNECAHRDLFCKCYR